METELAATYLSVVIPVFNEEANLPQLFDRLVTVLDGLGKPSEVIFTNDGSSDRSGEILRELHQRRPQQVRVIDFNGNYGQHMAVMAAFERVRGDVIVTLDADLQNPPEEIPKLLALFDQGYDAIGGRRAKRQDTWGRRSASRIINWLRERLTDIRMDDQGCMLRAYSRRVVETIASCGDRATFIPALAYKFASRPTEVDVEHHERAAGTSKYSYYKLVRLNFDLITGFTLVPLQWFTLFSFVSALGSFLLVCVIFFRRFIYPGQAEVEGVFTLFAILFFLISVAMVGIGLIGEYVGRMYQAVQRRPRYVLRELVEGTREADRPRVLVFAYSEVGFCCLELLIRRGANVVGLITHEDDPAETPWFRSVAQLAESSGIPVFRPSSLKDPAIERLVTEALHPDLIFSFYYRNLIPENLLERARLGAFNMHGSFLPQYRGKAPVNWAILNGENHSGATLHYMVAKPDAGDIVDQERVAIGERDTAAQVMSRVVAAAVSVLDRQLDALLANRAPRHPQDASAASYFGGRGPEDGRIDWGWPSQRIFNLIRAVTRPYPGAFADMPDGRRLHIWWTEIDSGHGSPGEILRTDPLVIATGDGAVRITDFEWRAPLSIQNACGQPAAAVG